MCRIVGVLLRGSLVAAMLLADTGVGSNFSLAAAEEDAATLADSKAGDKSARHPIPDEVASKAIVRKIEDLFPDEVRNARAKANHSKPLAEKLLALAPETHDLTERYVMLAEALKLLVTDAPQLPSSIPLIIDCANSLGSEYEVSPAKLKAEAFKVITADSKSTLSTIRQINRYMIPAVQQAVEHDDFVSASEILNAGRSVSKRLRDQKRDSEFNELEQDIAGLVEQHQAYLNATKTLGVQPDDKESNRIAGLYLGLRRNDWLAAERHIELLQDDDLLSLFVRTTAESRSPEETSRLADDWWNWASDQKRIPAKQARLYSASLYVDCIGQLNGLASLTADERKGFPESLPLIVTQGITKVAGDSKVSSEPMEVGKGTKPPGENAQRLSNSATVVNSIGMKFVAIPVGRFVMGDNTASQDVQLTKPFFMGAYEVTQAQYQQLMTANPSEFKGPENPVENVSWNDAVEFCKKLSELDEEKAANRIYRLPTEAEWEYSCRAGSDAVYCFGNDHSEMVQFAWTEQNSSGTTHPVGQKSANSWGLFDMHGNVFEWCADLHGDYGSDAVVDPGGAIEGTDRISRGGSWFHAPFHCRAATRVWNPPANFSNCQGFRVVLEVAGK